MTQVGEVLSATQLNALAKWRCHKIVAAGRIVGARTPMGVVGDWRVAPPENGFHLVIAGAGDATHLRGKLRPVQQVYFDCGEAWWKRHSPEIGGYFVVYDDGYLSYSPAKAFEAGYTRLDV